MPDSPLTHSILTPALTLVIWSLVTWAAMVATRLPAMSAAKIAPQKARHTSDLTVLPSPARDIADNYNHLMEQPTIFYALVFYTYLAGGQDRTSIVLAWAYAAIRVVHSLVQWTVNVVAVRFWLFVLSTLVLIALAMKDAVALFH
ncbi:MAG TPA: MAPEG family protein [Caulobacteraceae bacterium]|nr:MAPEG family protein [Caulobacteraceae bacterium]